MHLPQLGVQGLAYQGLEQRAHAAVIDNVGLVRHEGGQGVLVLAAISRPGRHDDAACF